MLIALYYGEIWVLLSDINTIRCLIPYSVRGTNVLMFVSPRDQIHPRQTIHWPPHISATGCSGPCTHTQIIDRITKL